MADHSEARAESALAVVAIALSGAFLVDGMKLKPGVFEPIGPGAVPMGVAVVTIVLSVLVLLGRWRRADPAAASTTPLTQDAHAHPERWGLLFGASALTLVYAGMLQLGVVRYGYATVVYLLATFLWVSDRARKDLTWAAVLALVFGLGLDYVFRYLLVADLP